MNKQERDELRDYANNVLDFDIYKEFDILDRVEIHDNILDLIDALDEMEKELEKRIERNNNFARAYDDMKSDRDRLQKRCEALERALVKYCSAGCFFCKYYNYGSGEIICESCSSGNLINWEFDDECKYFTVGGDGGE